MKHLANLTLGLMATMFLLTGCVAAIGNRDANGSNTTLGQQLIDLQKARDAGAISEADYEIQKSRLLQTR